MSLLQAASHEHWLTEVRLSQCSSLICLSPCSGHGFKFASTIGEILAGLVTEQRTRFDMSLFRLRNG